MSILRTLALAVAVATLASGASPPRDAPVAAPLVAAAAGCDRCNQETQEYCSLFPHSELCGAGAAACPFYFHAGTNRCWEAGTTPPPVVGASDGIAAPIIGGSGKFRYQYMPELLKTPAGGSFGNCHGLSVDNDENIILTYSDAGTDTHCLATWKPDGTGGTLNGDPALCSGTPHGLKITTEGDEQFLYHANNDKRLAKTTLDGEIVWIKNGDFGQNETCGPDMCPAQSCSCAGGKAPYIPTWFATPPDSKYVVPLSVVRCPVVPLSRCPAVPLSVVVSVLRSTVHTVDRDPVVAVDL